MAKIHVKVKKEFLDRYTGQIKRPGDELDMTYERLSEIRNFGDYVDVVKQEQSKAEKK